LEKQEKLKSFLEIKEKLIRQKELEKERIQYK
jgi:hypothetical protein